MEKAPRETLFSGLTSNPSNRKEFERIMDLRTHAFKEKACCDGHSEKPLISNGLRLACCDGFYSSCKIKEINFLLKELEGVLDSSEKLSAKISYLTNENQKLKQELNSHNRWPTFDGWPSDKIKTADPVPQISNVYQTTNIVNVNIIGDNAIKKRGKEILMLACKQQANCIDSARKFLAEDPNNHENAKLLGITDNNEFAKIVIDILKPAIEELPNDELKETAKQGLEKGEKELSPSGK